MLININITREKLCLLYSMYVPKTCENALNSIIIRITTYIIDNNASV